MTVSSEDGITIHYRTWKISLDSHRTPSADVAFISHAHIDHIHRPLEGSKVITSDATAFLAKERGYDLGATREQFDGLQLVNSGHILGSQGLLVDGELYYTGDFSARPRAFLEAGKAVKCSTLIIESTYGRNKYRFPPVAAVLEQTNRLISNLFSKGIPVVLMGYPLGKAQILSALFSSWDPIYVHGSVWRMNQAYVKLGVDLRADLQPYSQASEKGLLRRRPWILISPMRSGRSAYIRSLKKNYGAVTVAFTGWSVDPGYKHAMAVDHALPLTDHCDFDELVDLVKRCSPDKVYTIHGYAEDFAAHLRNLGFDAEPLHGVQTSLADYFHGE